GRRRPGDPAGSLPRPRARRPPCPARAPGRGGARMSLPALTWDDFQLPSIGVPSLPVPDLWGSPIQWLVLVPALTALAGITLAGRSNRLGAWIAVGGALATAVVSLWQLYTLTQIEDGTRAAGTIGPLSLG